MACRHTALYRQSSLVGCQVDNHTCTGTAEPSTKEQLLALPEHSLPRGSGGRVRPPWGQGCHPAAQTELLAQPPLVAAAGASAKLDVVWVWPPSPLLCNLVLWDSCCGHHPTQLWLKRPSRRKGAQHCPAVYTQAVHQVPLLSWLSFCYMQHCKVTLALVPLLQSWWCQGTPTCSTPWTAMWTSISSCGKKLQPTGRWKWGAVAVWHSPGLPSGGAGATGPTKLHCEEDKAAGRRTVPLLPSSITESQQMNVSVFNFEDLRGWNAK